MPQDTIRGAVDEVLVALKDDSLKDFDKKKEIEGNIGSISSDNFAKLVNLGKAITDYRPEDAEQVNVDDGSGAQGRNDGIDQEHGVAVLFDESDEEGSEEGDGYEVRDSDEEELDDEVMANRSSSLLKSGGADGGDVGEEGGEASKDMLGDDFTTIIPSTAKSGSSNNNTTNTSKSTTSSAAATAASDSLDAHDIDAFWLQRNISTYYTDAHTSQSKTTSAFEILSSTSSIRDCENDLVALFDYDKFDLVKLLTRNRELIVWCTKLAKAGPDSGNIKQQMTEQGLGHILQRLNVAPVAKTGGEVGIRRGVVESAMEVNAASKRQSTNKSSVVTAAATVAPKSNIDLESLSFQQGGHLMSNKTVKLPEGSFKRSKKGYEEVHVPPPAAKPRAEGDKDIPISSLPDWAQKAFQGARSLNRVQTKVFPTAFESDENMLLCAPTGAGKVCYGGMCVCLCMFFVAFPRS